MKYVDFIAMKISEIFENYLNVFVRPYQSKGTALVFENAKKSLVKFGDINLEDLEEAFSKFHSV